MSTVTELVILAKTDPAQYTALWTACERLIRYWANRYHTEQGERLYDTDDLIQSGFIALVDAVQTFDPERAGFTTLLRFYVRRRFAEVSGHKGTKQRPELYAVSLDEPIGDEGDATRLDMLVDPHDAIADVDRRVWLEALQTQLDISLDALPYDGGDVLRERYYRGKSQAEIARERDVARETVRQKESKALRTIRRPAYCKRLQPFAEEIATNYHYHVGLERFRSTGLSAVEELVIRRERFTKG